MAPATVDPRTRHGTIVAGLVAGDDAERGIVGLAPDAHVVPIRILDGDSEFVDEGAAARVRQPRRRDPRGDPAAARRENVRVINLSLVLDAPSKAVADAIAAAQERGHARRRRGRQPTTRTSPAPAPPTPTEVGEQQVRFPATEKGVLGVTALDAGR